MLYFNGLLSTHGHTVIFDKLKSLHQLKCFKGTDFSYLSKKGVFSFNETSLWNFSLKLSLSQSFTK